MLTGLLFQAFVYLIASVITVPIAKRLGLGSVLGYLIAGVMIGPILGIVGSETEALQQFAEFGIVMMLFLVGLELEPKLLWDMRRRLLGLGGLQLGACVAAVTGVGVLLGLSWQIALIIGLIVTQSSSAIVLQTLTEKGLMKTDGGEASFATLLFQDIAVIPTLAIIPLLAMPDIIGDANIGAAGQAHETLLAALPGWARVLATFAAVGVVVCGGHFLMRPLLRFIGESKLREIFTAAALLLVIATALLMELVGLSPAFGTFLAGVVLANNEYRHELESDIAPFKGLLLGLFFITVGAGIDVTVLLSEYGVILAMVVGIIALKFTVLFGMSKLLKVSHSASWLVGLGLCQVGEFGFVLINFSTQNHALPSELGQMLSLVVALSMMLTPFLFIAYDKFIMKPEHDSDVRDADNIDDIGNVIIAGHGRFGQVVNRLLLAMGYKTVVLDHQSSVVDDMRRFGIRTFFGDASRPDLLIAAGLSDAKILIVAIDDVERSVEIVKFARRERPDLHIIARARNRVHVYTLYQAGASDIVRETFDSAMRAGRYALTALGEHPFQAERVSSLYTKFDRKALAQMAPFYSDDGTLANEAGFKNALEEYKVNLTDAIALLQGEKHARGEKGWTPPPRSFYERQTMNNPQDDSENSKPYPAEF